MRILRTLAPYFYPDPRQRTLCIAPARCAQTQPLFLVKTYPARPPSHSLRRPLWTSSRPVHRSAVASLQDFVHPAPLPFSSSILVQSTRYIRACLVPFHRHPSVRPFISFLRVLSYTLAIPQCSSWCTLPSRVLSSDFASLFALVTLPHPPIHPSSTISPVYSDTYLTHIRPALCTTLHVTWTRHKITKPLTCAEPLASPRIRIWRPKPGSYTTLCHSCLASVVTVLLAYCVAASPYGHGRCPECL
ncbi:hypothetical protein FKP32DRAFT_1074910 [Trametes sanguinea]|nr:hypothetical protein FKP32DRAFT_1074910 [Trametes sanguinea]